jgi:hypothetical protein
MPNDHFVPRHYLRQFAASASELIVVANISPYRFLGLKGIGGQCCEDDFYENNNAIDKLLGVSENDLAPVLVRVIRKRDFDTKEINALKMLAVILNVRTRKAIEAAKVFPRFIAKAFIESAIEQGRLPPLPEGNSLDEAIDFKGVAGVLIQQMIPCWMETQTLSAKLLKAHNGTCFITSDNPAVVLNQFAWGADTTAATGNASRVARDSVCVRAGDANDRDNFARDALPAESGHATGQINKFDMDV